MATRGRARVPAHRGECACGLICERRGRCPLSLSRNARPHRPPPSRLRRRTCRTLYGRPVRHALVRECGMDAPRPGSPFGSGAEGRAEPRPRARRPRTAVSPPRPALSPPALPSPPSSPPPPARPAAPAARPARSARRTPPLPSPPRALDLDWSDPDTLTGAAGAVLGLLVGIGAPLFYISRDEKDEGEW